MRAAHDALVATRASSRPRRATRSPAWRRELRREQRGALRLAPLQRLGRALAARTCRAVAADATRDDAPVLRGFEVLNACFDAALGARSAASSPSARTSASSGDVNQGFAGLQEKYGELRVADTGIREAHDHRARRSAWRMRGLRPIAEIQYLDYVLYALQILSDDLATLRWRTAGGQKAPVIVRTRGHRLEGIWHSGSPMAGILHLVRGMLRSACRAT